MTGENNHHSKSHEKGSVEKIYQKKTPIEHVLLRPDTYIGSVEPQEQEMWCYEGEEIGLVNKKVTYVPGLYKIFDEILVNAADNKQRDPSMDILRVEINPDENKISIYNNGKGIPVVEHKDEKMFVPTMIFGHLLTSSNYDDSEKRVTGGRHGYGAKLCNIFSTKFIVETSSKEYKLAFKQVWTKNMSHTSEPKIVPATGDDYTKITFYPDLPKFNMTSLDKDIVGIFSRRVHDVAGSAKGGVKVYLNGKRIKVTSFKSYVELYLNGMKDENGEQVKFTYDDCGDRWQIAVAPSDKGFQQVSFVNSIATTKGGKHVDHVLDQIVQKLAETVKKKNKAKVDIKPHMIKSNIWLFINCLIENPSFDSQTKENMTLQIKKFGSKCQPSDKFFNALAKSSIIEGIMAQAMAKADKLKESQGGKKSYKALDIDKLDDANFAGRSNSSECTLILTEGDSAKTLVKSGFEVIGRDKYGVFPLKGKLLNVREANHKQIVENKEIQNLLKIIGLDYRKKYDSDSDLKSLRYGKVMIMTDQDQDGSHIKGLLINFIHHNWPNLLKKSFLEEFITPIVRARKKDKKDDKKVINFYSLPELHEWLQNTPNTKSWTLKYYKGLGTSTGNEAKEYFSDLERHRIVFKYQGDEDDHALILAFSKKMIEQRKDWLTNFMEDRKRRKELGLHETHLYSSRTKEITYRDFVNKELIHFSNMDNERSIPSLVDGFKPSQRKVMFAAFKRKLTREIKVTQLGGIAGEKACYHHGDASLHATIIGLAQNFVGSNNINLLVPSGQFGSRNSGGKDHAAPRYLFTSLSSLARKIFPVEDDPLLNYLWDDNTKVEPEYYVPILPLVMVNGAEGIGTGWSTKIPNFDPREIVANLKRMLNGDEPKPMKPWFRGFRGSIDKVDAQRYVISGEIARLEGTEVEITELPVRTWTDTYKENVLIPMRKGTEKSPPMIEDFMNHSTNVSIRMVITLGDQNMRKAEEQGMHKYFKLQTTLSTSSMVLFDSKGCLRRFDSPDDILKEFFEVRLDFYNRRKEYKKGLLQAETAKLTNQVRFILEKNDGSLKMENVKRKELVETLKMRGYDSDPVKAWIAKNKIDCDDDEEEEQEEQPEPAPSDVFDVAYLLSMPMHSMVREKVDELVEKKEKKKAELDQINRTTIEDLWRKDLDDFLEELVKVEKKEIEEYQDSLREHLENQKQNKSKQGSQSKSKSKKRAKVTEDELNSCMPTAWAERIEPQIDQEFFRKREALVSEKIKKQKLKKEDGIKEGDDDFDDVKMDDDDIELIDIDDRPLSERIGISPQMVDAKKSPIKAGNSSLSTPKTTKSRTPKSSEKKSSVNGSKPVKGKAGAKKKKKNPWSDSEEDEDSPEELDAFSDEDFLSYVPKTQEKKRSQANDSGSSKSTSLQAPQNGSSLDLTKTSNSSIPRIDSDSDDSILNQPVKTQVNRTSEDLFDTIFRAKPTSSESDKNETRPTTPSTSYQYKPSSPLPSMGNSSPASIEFDESPPKSTPKSKTKAPKTPKGPKKPSVKRTTPKKRKKAFSSDDEDFDITPKKGKSKTTTAKKKPKAFSSSDTEPEPEPESEAGAEADAHLDDNDKNSDFHDVSNYVSSTRVGRNKKPINYKCDMSTDEDSG
ncbi:DNA topoisomerase 2-alpha-like [Brevipalpus obovatus]|uniref:DNA topoisomerase 2-alpha-like n=1 Tax=Brevipalpus obovatus TaxID=246614 RepID=UPI003D9F8FBB